MGDIVKTDRDNKALRAALEEAIKKHGLKADVQLGSLNWKLQSEIMQRAYALRKEYE
jgi:hypothetical protein